MFSPIYSRLIKYIQSFTCFVGFFGGVGLGQAEQIQIWILGIAAGAFIYIALVDMLPEIRLNSIHREESPLRRFIGQGSICFFI